ncbi:hypothetical protein [Niveispirillum sp. SYP-B3756]|uniref:hypothetical protein n=1 Tax=Niveispirillum sp. SYP-B3756 TaxID=2662178 RepID=UPI001291CA6D|nr:hypothetical protein [Niveispirillum sp. SYP-B3756]
MTNPPQKRPLFRAQALDRLTTPDRMDQPLLLARPRHGMLLAALVLLVMGIGWVGFG